MAFWIPFFAFLMFCVNFTSTLIIKCIKEKSLGTQSIFDSSVRDTLVLMRWYGSLASILCMLSRSEYIRNLLLEHEVILALASILFTFSLILLCVHAGCLCHIRILWLTKMAFLEETIGEPMIRTMSLLVSTLSALAGTIVIFLSNNELTGSAVTVLTEKVILTGKLHFKIFLLPI